MRYSWIVALALVPLGCVVGPSAGGFEPANGPAGIAVALETTQRHKLAAELLEVQDTALLVLADAEVRLAPYRAIRRASFRQRANLSFGDGRTPSPDILLHLRQVARFPAGLPPGLLERLLDAHKQGAVRVVE